MSKKQITNLLSWSVLALVALFLAYTKGWIFTNFESISPKQAHEMLLKDKNVVLLDVRTPDEFSQEFIEGATLIPVQALNDTLFKLEDKKDKTIIVYCHSGNRSVTASRILSDNGFHPLNLKGGIAQWKSDGLPVVH
ncbi:MAG: rhodanese-like domain-containing protein [Sulfuricurvum sp.]|uniref:rhodanese-like domain-containing protein n=1 Tax=Sulfuricurvum sp. TaxID=2025608 RepID=UPI00260E749F|nr:rhodanese-like domain-containing protein [Sulfuricurvum sp.]MDD2829065.1 rhodanese-like domain-containing protein [Sulfuricurvum sp.]MDD4948813.1 rhodanese-like domain-containing protein [Sulfuricurvum sp.]